jgi:hypothetical protein
MSSLLTRARFSQQYFLAWLSTGIAAHSMMASVVIALSGGQTGGNPEDHQQFDVH